MTTDKGSSAAIPLPPSSRPRSAIHFTTGIARSARPRRSTCSTFPSAKATLARCSITRSSSTSSHHVFRRTLRTHLESPVLKPHAIRRPRENPRKTAKNRYPLSYTNLFGYTRQHITAHGDQMNTRNAPPRFTPPRRERRDHSSGSIRSHSSPTPCWYSLRSRR